MHFTYENIFNPHNCYLYFTDKEKETEGSQVICLRYVVSDGAKIWTYRGSRPMLSTATLHCTGWCKVVQIHSKIKIHQINQGIGGDAESNPKS